MVAHSEILLSKCAQFREQGEFVDVRLKVAEDLFPAHRIVLAANSDYFHAMFAHGMKESNQEVIELKDDNISATALKIIMDSIYSGQLHVDDENVFEILPAADHLQVTSVLQQCCDYLEREFVERRFDVPTYCRINSIADRHGLKDLLEATQRKMASMFKEICETEEFLSQIDADRLLSLLSRDDLSAPSETFVFKSVLQWINYKKEERMAVAAKVIGAVRLGLVDIKDVIEELNTEEMQGVPEIQVILSQALLHNHMPSHTSKFAVEKAKPRSMSTVLVAVSPGRLKEGEGYSTVMNYFDFGTKTWKPLQLMASLKSEFKITYLCTEYAGNYLYVATRTQRGLPAVLKKRGFGVIYRYHVVNNVWETLPSFQSASRYGDYPINCLCSVNDYIYAISDTNLIQRYSLAQNKWQSGPKSCVGEGNLSHVSAVVMKSKIYVLHGCSKMVGEESLDGQQMKKLKEKKTRVELVVEGAVVHCFDTQTNEWEEKAKTRHPHFGFSLFVNDNKLYVVGGKCSVSNDHFMNPAGNPAPVEVYDEVRNSWSVVEQTHIPPNSLGAVEINGKVFFVINKFPVDSGIRIPPGEVYRISLQEWEGKGGISSIGHEAIMCYLPVKVDSLKIEPPCAKE